MRGGVGRGIVAGRVLQMAAGRISGKAGGRRLGGRVQAAAPRLVAPLIRRHRQFHLNRLAAARGYLDGSAQGVVNGRDQASYVILCYLPVAVEVVQGEREFLPPTVALRHRDVAFEFLKYRGQIDQLSLSSFRYSHGDTLCSPFISSIRDLDARYLSAMIITY